MRRLALTLVASTTLGGCDTAVDSSRVLLVRPPEATLVAVGPWASEPSAYGEQMVVTVEARRARWADNSYCERGTTSGPLVVDADGRFTATGVVNIFEDIVQDVRLVGTIHDDRMTLEFIYPGRRRTYVLTRGRPVGRASIVC